MSIAREIVGSPQVSLTWLHAGQLHTTAAVKVKEVFPGIDGRVAVVLVLDEAHAPERPWDSADIRAARTKALCPGEHKPVQHRDGKPPWCDLCGQDALGRMGQE